MHTSKDCSRGNKYERFPFVELPESIDVVVFGFVKEREISYTCKERKKVFAKNIVHTGRACAKRQDTMQKI